MTDILANLNILFEDNEIIVCNKPAGIAVESANIRTPDMVSMVKSHLRDTGNAKEPYLGLVHRLDQPVSGILVFAKTPAAAASLSRQVQTEDMRKYYTATVQGDAGKIDISLPSIKTNEDNSLTVTDYLVKDGKSSIALIANKGQKGPDGKPSKEAKLILQVLSYNESDNTSVLGIRLLTGRFHQIRAQLSNLGYPILNDTKYGAIAVKDCPGIALCAEELSFIHPTTKKVLIFHL